MGWLRSRWDYVSGILFVLLFVVAFLLTDDSGDTPAELRAFYTDSGNQTKQFAAFFIFLAAMLAFLWFLGTLRAELFRSEGADGALTSIAFGSGLVFTVLMTAGLTLLTSPAFMASDDNFTFDPNTANFMQDAGYGLFVAALIFSSVLLLSTSLVSYRTRMMPLWFAWVSVPAAIALLFGVFFFPIVVLLLWVLILSIVMLLRARRAEHRMTTTTPAAPPTEAG
jgi:hypothetical protein